MPRFLVSSHYSIEPEDEVALFREILGWAGAHATHFKILIETGVYRRLDELERLRALADFAPAEPPYEPGVLEGEGTLSSAVLEALSTVPVPEGAISGDLCPVLRLELSRDGETLYTVADYGRTQLLDLGPEALEELKRALSKRPEWPGRLVPWPAASS